MSFNNQIRENLDKNIVVVVSDGCNNINVVQPQTTVIEISSGIRGDRGPQGEQGTGPSLPFNNVSASVWATTSSITITGSLTVSGSNTFRNIGPAIFSGSVDISGSETINGYLDLKHQSTIPSSSNGRIYYQSGSDGFVLYSQDPSNNEYHTQFKNSSSAFGVYLANLGSTPIQIGSTTNGALGLFVNNGSPKIRISTAGNVAINSTLDHNIPFNVNGNTNITGSLLVTGGITGSLFGTASNSLTASYLNPLTQSVLISGSIFPDGLVQFIGEENQGIQFGTNANKYIKHASNTIIHSAFASHEFRIWDGAAYKKYFSIVQNGTSPLTIISGSAKITGSLDVTGSIIASGSITTFDQYRIGINSVLSVASSNTLQIGTSNAFTNQFSYIGGNLKTNLSANAFTLSSGVDLTLNSGSVNINTGSLNLTGSIKAFITGSDLVNIGNAVTTNQRLVRIGQHTAYMDLGSLVGFGNIPAIYFGASAPSLTNYTLAGDSAFTLLNATNNINFRISNNDIATLTSTLVDIKKNTLITGSLIVSGSLLTTGSFELWNTSSALYNFKINNNGGTTYIGNTNTNVAALWMQQAAPSQLNYVLRSDGTTTDLNTATTIYLRQGATIFGDFAGFYYSFRPLSSVGGNGLNFMLSASADSAMPTGQNLPSFIYYQPISRSWGGTTQIPNQYEFLLKQPTYAGAGVTGMTSAYNLFVFAPTGSPSMIITSSYAAGFSGSIQVIGNQYVTGGLNIVKPTEQLRIESSTGTGSAIYTDGSGQTYFSSTGSNPTFNFNNILNLKASLPLQFLGDTTQAASRGWALRNDVTAFGDFKIMRSLTNTGGIATDVLVFNSLGNATLSGSLNIQTTGLIATGSLQVTGSATITGSIRNLISGSESVSMGWSSMSHIFRSIPGTPTQPAYYLGVPSGSETAINYTLNWDGNLKLNTQTSVSGIILSAGGSSRFTITSGDGTNTPHYFFQLRDRSNLPASTEVQMFRFASSTQTWNSGSMVMQRNFHLQPQTIAFASSSLISSSYGLFVEAPVMGTNATSSTNYAAGFSGSVQISGSLHTSGSILISEGASNIRLSSAVGIPSYSSIYLSPSPGPNANNWALASDGNGNTFLNGSVSVYIAGNGSNIARWTTVGLFMTGSANITGSLNVIGNSYLTGSVFIQPGSVTNQGIVLRDKVGSSTVGALYLSVTPNSANHALTHDGATVIFNGVDNAIIQNSGVTYFDVRRGGYGSGTRSGFTFSPGNNTGQTAGTEISGFLYNSYSREWTGSNITTQREHYIKSVTYTANSSSLFSNTYGWYVEAPTISTNVTASNNWAAGFDGNINFITSNATINNSSGGNQIMNVATGGSFLISVNNQQKFNLSTNNILFNVGVGGTVTFGDGVDLVTNTVAGSKLAKTSSQKLGFWGATPIVQPSSSFTTSSLYVQNSGSAINVSSSFDGYTIPQLVAILRAAGLLA